MENTNQYVTKREFYFISTNILTIVIFTMLLLSDREGFWKLYMVLWALGFLLYCAYKLRSVKINSQGSDIDQN